MRTVIAIVLASALSVSMGLTACQASTQQEEITTLKQEVADLKDKVSQLVALTALHTEVDKVTADIQESMIRTLDVQQSFNNQVNQKFRLYHP